MYGLLNANSYIDRLDLEPLPLSLNEDTCLIAIVRPFVMVMAERSMTGSGREWSEFLDERHVS